MIELNKIYQEPCLETIKRFDDDSIDCVITSPPYWQLRDYGYDGQWGLEPTFELYLEHLWSMIEALIPKLKSNGTMWINLGDTYGTKSGGMASSVDYSSKESKHAGSGAKVQQSKSIHKSLLLLPHRFAIGCIDRGLMVRNDIVWAKRNAMPESVTDRFSKKHEYFFLMTKSNKYYFDLDGIRDKLKNNVSIRNKASEIYGRGSGSSQFSEGFRVWGDEDKGKNPGSVSDFWDTGKSYPNRKYFFRENYFETIDSDDKAYWLGFIWADAYLNKNSLELEIHTKDKEHLLSFQEDLMDNHLIYERQRNKTSSVRLTLGSQKLVSDLKSLGYKSKEVPNISHDFEYAFIRGLFDGDGSVGVYSGYKGSERYWLELLGKEKLLIWVSDRLYKTGMYNQTPKKIKGTYRLSYVDNDAAIFYDYAYSGYTRSLDRKRLRFPQELNREFDFFDIPTKPSTDAHYAAYNDELIKKPIIAGCPKGGLIYDPFMGSGNTAIMALRTGRNYVGSEMSSDYCKIADKKIKPFKIQTQLF